MKIIAKIISHLILIVKMNLTGENPHIKTKTPETREKQVFRAFLPYGRDNVILETVKII